MLYRLSKTATSVMFKPDQIRFRPIYLQIESTNHCNLKCKFCQRDKMEAKLEHLSPERFEFILTEFRPRFLNLGGDGEPLLNPEIDKLIRMAKESGATTNFATNGTLLDHWAEKLIDAKLDLLKISIDSASPGIYRKIRNVDQHSKIVQGIKTLQDVKRIKKRKKPHLRFNIVICRDNLEELTSIVRLAQELDVPTINFKTIDVIGQEEKSAELLWGTIEEDRLLHALKAAYKVSKKYGIKTNLHYLITRYREYKIRYSEEKIKQDIKRKVYCLIPWFTTYIKVNGDLAPCCPFALGNVNTSLGNIYANGIDNALNSKRYARFRNQMKSGDPSYKFCRFCFEAQNLSNYLINFKMLRHFWL